MKISYQKDVEFRMPHPKGLGMEPPEGKELSDFVCWVGFEDKDKPYLSNEYFMLPGAGNQYPMSTLIDMILSTDDEMKITNCEFSFNVYACWDSYGFADELSGNAIFNHVASKVVTQALHTSKVSKLSLDKYGFCSQSIQVSQQKKDLIPNYNIKYSIQTASGKKLNNVYLNGELFAGKDVTEEYWNSHKGDLYKGIDPELSVNHVWKDGLVNGSV